MILIKNIHFAGFSKIFMIFQACKITLLRGWKVSSLGKESFVSGAISFIRFPGRFWCSMTCNMSNTTKVKIFKKSPISEFQNFTDIMMFTKCSLEVVPRYLFEFSFSKFVLALLPWWNEFCKHKKWGGNRTFCSSLSDIHILRLFPQ